ncbi:rhamnan synthesis F family protein [Paraburkholderia fungorum]|jgi:lipopolysaccharide biosynthesis protein|uniref:rhamnan synthesis F family protein n=3 Tax=Paraburkholderia fungorum TaxID=134537 RepID=UPI00138DFE88|nr:rhamnan synthesis F family protein [Paraburkholderia fungorum]MBB5543045.1 rhamnosyltransferase [Paraburkholderia fungorum]
MRQLLEVADHLIVVSTGLRPEAFESSDPRITVVLRQNVGYDFYSFKVGIESISALWAYDELIVANDSIYMVRDHSFSDVFERMSDAECDMWAMTISDQIVSHAQSYFVVFRKSVLVTPAFAKFWRNVRVLDNKWEIILNYEVGMTQHFVAHGARIKAAFRPKFGDFLTIAWRLAARRKVIQPFQFLIELLHWRRVRSSNLTHYLWDRVASELGFLKCEVLRDNPNGLRMHRLAEIVGTERVSEINAEMTRMRRKRPVGDAVAPAAANSVSILLPEFLLSSIDLSHLHAELAVIVHLYHVDLADEISDYLDNIVVPVDVFVSVKSVEDYFSAEQVFSRRGHKVFLYVHENIGRDVGPFISLLNSGLLDRYLCVCKIHSKKSVYSAKGQAWRDSLFSSLLGNSYRVLKIVEAFRRNPSCGIVGPDDAFVTHARFWGGNEARLRHLASRLGIPDAQVSLGFFAGTMFWFRPAALDGLRALHIETSDFEAEAGQRDATLAHVIERAFSLAAQHAGFYSASTTNLDEPIDPAQFAERGVMVLDEQ